MLIPLVRLESAVSSPSSRLFFRSTNTKLFVYSITQAVRTYYVDSRIKCMSVGSTGCEDYDILFENACFYHELSSLLNGHVPCICYLYNICIVA
jgi:hypothetical protein